MDFQTKNGVVYWLMRLNRIVERDGVVTEKEMKWLEQFTVKVKDKATGKVVEVNPHTFLKGDYLVPSHQDDLELI
jgi:hypothetical protein